MEKMYTPERETAIRKHYEIEKIWFMVFVLFMIILYDTEALGIDTNALSYIFIGFFLVWIFGYGLWRFFARKKLDIELNSKTENWIGYIWFASIIALKFL